MTSSTNGPDKKPETLAEACDELCVAWQDFTHELMQIVEPLLVKILNTISKLLH